ncbi:MAG: phospholipase A [Bdellovibrionales bacterium]
MSKLRSLDLVKFSSLVLVLQWSAMVHATDQTPTEQESSESRTINDETRREERILQRHSPLYFAYGEPNSKLQLSFKSAVIRGFPLYMAYTQVMFWELNAESKPFRDFTYAPELFYRMNLQEVGWLKSVDFGLFGHNSNGKSGDASRSLDMNYLRFNFEREGRRWTTRFSTQFAYLHGFDPGNNRIQDYVGPLTFSLTFIQLFDSWLDKTMLTFSAAPGGKFAQDWDRGGYQVSWAFRLGGLDLIPAFYVQYYYGYAETLLNFDQHNRELRVGLTL